jgi:hypothetical protein
MDVRTLPIGIHNVKTFARLFCTCAGRHSYWTDPCF